MKTMSLALADCVSQPPSMGASRCLSFYGAKKPAAPDENDESGSGRLRQPTAIHGCISLPFISLAQKNRLRSIKTMSLALADCVSQPPSMGASCCLSFYGAKKPAALDENNESGSGRLRQPTAIHGRISLPFILWRKKTGCAR